MHTEKKPRFTLLNAGHKNYLHDLHASTFLSPQSMHNGGKPNEFLLGLCTHEWDKILPLGFPKAITLNDQILIIKYGVRKKLYWAGVCYMVNMEVIVM